MVQTPTEWKPQFKVNTFDSLPEGNDQTDPVVAGLSNGNIVVVWQSPSEGGSSELDIKAQIYDLLGNKVGSEIRLNNNFFFDDQFAPAVAATNDGGFVIAYQDDVTGTGSFNIVAERFDSTGVTVGGVETIATSVDEETAPTITAFSDNSYLVVYEDDSTGSSNINGIIVSSGGVVGTEFTIATDADDETSPTVDTLSNNNAVVVYLDPNGGDTSDVRVVFEIYDSSGAVVRNETVITTNGLINREAHVAALAGGGFVVTWTDPGVDGNSDGIAAAVYDNAGTQIVAPFQVNNNVAGSQNEVRVAAIADGGFVIIWDDDNSDIIRGQRFDASATEVGNQFSMDRQTETALDIAGLSDGRFIIGFERITPGGNSDIFAQIWDPRDTTIVGTLGNDAIAGRVEGSNISGGIGNDTLAGLNGNDTINGSFGTDLIFGGGGNDSLLGSFQNDTIMGDGGDDFIDGGANNDSLLGGFGNDEIHGDTGADFLDGGGGSDTLFGGDDNDTLEGSTGDDELRGEGGDDNLSGGGGKDTLIGREGNDSIEGGVSDDLLFGGDGADTIRGNNGVDQVSGQADNDSVFGGAGDDKLFGKNGDDTLDGEGGADSLVGGAGADEMFGGTGADTLFGINGMDTLKGGGGADSLVGGTDDDVLYGDGADDILEGNAGNDFLGGGGVFGGNGDDTLNGGGGDDTLWGANQDDVLTGGPGDDVFLYFLGDDNDVITDFVAGGTDDHIELDGFGTDFDTFTEVLEAATQVGLDTVIDFGGGDVITLQNVDKSDLTAADFIFM
ncbi:MAG: calcium-binding protein [Alphaproteobacteria bacterium]|nr:calcium-binding protein [Alphaproteobacteria bacterium]